MTPRGRHPGPCLATGRDKMLWAGGHCVGAVGLDKARVREYMRGQVEGSRSG